MGSFNENDRLLRTIFKSTAFKLLEMAKLKRRFDHAHFPRGEREVSGIWSCFVKGQQGVSLLIAGRFLDNPCRLVPAGIGG